MSIIRIQHNKENPYVMLNKSVLEDPSISWEAKGLWAYLMSRPDNWQVSVNQLKKIYKENGGGRDAIYSILKELMDQGYCERLHHKKEGRFSSHEYVISEFKKIVPQTGFPEAVLPEAEKAPTNNKGILKKNENNNKPPAVVVVPLVKEEESESDEDKRKRKLIAPYDFTPKIYQEFMKLSFEQLVSGLDAYHQQAKTKQMSKGALITAIRQGWKPNKNQKESEKDKIEKELIMFNTNKKTVISLVNQNKLSFNEQYNLQIKEYYVEIKEGKAFECVSFTDENCVERVRKFIQEYLN